MRIFHIIPTLYHLARMRGRPMTSLVAEALDNYVAGQDLSPIAHLIATSERRHALREAPYTPRPVARSTD